MAGRPIAEVYEKHADDLVRFATGLVGPSDALDIVSAVMVRILAGSSTVTIDNGRAYLFRAVLNEARMHHRGTMRRRAREALAAGRVAVTETPMVRPDVLAAVGQLSVRQRAVVVLTYWYDLDDAATAQLLGISSGSVRRHLARALTHLRKSVAA